MRFSYTRGFTLIEVMVTVTIIGILSAIVLTNMGNSAGRGRDADRKADLRILQSAIEAYKQRYGQYPPMGCAPGADSLSGENDCSNYIAGIDSARPFVPDFITALPRDPRRGTNVGFAYTTNTEGTTYKLMVVSTVETEVVNATNVFRSCDIGTNGLCIAPVTSPTPNVCLTTNARFRTSYGVWGGYASGADPSDEAAARTATAGVICR